MVKITSIEEYKPVDLKLGIKSSMPNMKSTLALLILLGLTTINKYSVAYSTEVNDTIEISDSAFNEIKAKISDILDDFQIDTDDLRTIINRNQLFTSQIESLIVAFELCYELARFSFNNENLAYSSERTGRKRYAKTIYFTSNIDYIELLESDNQKKLFAVLLNWLGLDVQLDLQIESRLIRTLTLISEKAIYKLVDGDGDVIFNQLEIYKPLVDNSELLLRSNQEPKGSFRILPSILKDGLNSYLEFNRNNSIVKSRVSRDELFAYVQRLEKYLELENKKISLNNNYSEDSKVIVDSHDDSERRNGGENTLFYGVPGSGKSFAIEKDYGNERMVRVVFHPDYMNTDFIGQILPTIKEDDTISYEFKPGPFTKIMEQAYNDPSNMYYLVIEEINRGNAPAIFGEIFQLLDRSENGESKYAVVNYDVAKVIYGIEEKPVKIPSNLTLLATMNTSDQNVFTLDTAFQRRWSMRMIVNDINKAEHRDEVIADSTVTWGRFNSVINDLILSSNTNMLSSEDKRLGAYFVSPTDLRRRVDIERSFSEKVIKYLWDDAFKFSRDKLFDTSTLKSLEDVILMFISQTGDNRFNIFKDDIKKSLVSKTSVRTSGDSEENETLVAETEVVENE